jgi:hypothetical protein
LTTAGYQAFATKPMAVTIATATTFRGKSDA